MASLKEIKERINSVSSTQKITSAMKMVSAAKLHKSQAAIVGMGPYSRALSQVMEGLLAGATLDFPLTAHREVERVAIVAFSSDSSLCGAFNTNVARLLSERGIPCVYRVHEAPPAEKLIDFLKAHYDMIFIDLPPALIVSDATVISEYVTVISAKKKGGMFQ